MREARRAERGGVGGAGTGEKKKKKLTVGEQLGKNFVDFGTIVVMLAIVTFAILDKANATACSTLVLIP